jgi:hypothetical protein
VGTVTAVGAGVRKALIGKQFATAVPVALVSPQLSQVLWYAAFGAPLVEWLARRANYP